MGVGLPITSITPKPLIPLWKRNICCNVTTYKTTLLQYLLCGNICLVSFFNNDNNKFYNKIKCDNYFRWQLHARIWHLEFFLSLSYLYTPRPTPHTITVRSHLLLPTPNWQKWNTLSPPKLVLLLIMFFRVDQNNVWACG